MCGRRARLLRAAAAAADDDDDVADDSTKPGGRGAAPLGGARALPGCGDLDLGGAGAGVFGGSCRLSLRLSLLSRPDDDDLLLCVL